MKKVVFALVATLVMSLTLFCAHSVNAEVRGITSNTIKVGVIIPMTGPAASLGVPAADAIKTYIRYINEHGGINGRQLNLIVEDDRYSIPPSIAALKKLVYRDKVFALLGPGSASQVNVLWKAIQKDKLPTIPVATPEIAVIPLKKYIYYH